jgi:hypothetical protein
VFIDTAFWDQAAGANLRPFSHEAATESSLDMVFRKNLSRPGLEAQM